ncbi:MAG: hypothetical protein QG574_382 [Cyanobacteriota bacterium erpe_2018_sw_21hr_WHONDRS-SW48-000092_B_bin.40]|nr:hypothetical protein [Cyanobacteriota bacterium erpe_2018_sw_21hr_WHONDRS-SW48-000092_B_bin.40]
MKSPVCFNLRRSAYFLIAPALTIGILTLSPLSLQAKEQDSKEPNQAKLSTKEKSGKADSETKEQTVVLGDKLAVVKLPKEFRFVEPERAIAFLKEQGSSGEGVLGIIAPRKDSPDMYFIVCRYEDCGYVTEDDADKINANDLLNTFKEANKEQNEERIAQKIQPYYVGGWAEKPRYDKASHQMIWAIEVKEVDSADAPADTINYNTRMLGRRGVLSMNLVVSPKELELGKQKVATLLQNVKFNKGQTYAEYVAGTDKAAGYGLAGLILGGGAMAAAAKFGIFGALWKWGLGILLVLKKFIIIGIVGVVALVSKLFKGKGKGSEGSATASEGVSEPAPEHGEAQAQGQAAEPETASPDGNGKVE